MRFLSIAALAAGCYNANVADCADSCGGGQLCPDGTSCHDGYCRTAGATGSCGNGASIDAAHLPIDGPPPPPIDAMPAIDSMPPPPDGGSCPPAPMGQGACTSAMPIPPVSPECFVQCGPGTTGTTADAYSIGTWRAAKMSSDADESAAATLLAPGPLWIGLHRPNGGAFTWPDGTQLTYTHWAQNHPTGTAEACVTDSSNGWVDEPCTNSHPFLIRP